jgi:hypothetical protein
MEFNFLTRNSITSFAWRRSREAQGTPAGAHRPGIRSGQLTPKETAKLENKEAALNKEIRRDRKDGGELTVAERRKINRRQNRVTREIYQERHDGQTRP